MTASFLRLGDFIRITLFADAAPFRLGGMYKCSINIYHHQTKEIMFSQVSYICIVAPRLVILVTHTLHQRPEKVNLGIPYLMALNVAIFRLVVLLR